MYSSFFLLGRIYKESEVTTTESGLSIGTLYVSTRENYNSKEIHHKISIVGDRKFCESLKIGDTVSVGGKVSSHEWSNYSGEPRISTRLMVSTYNKVEI